MPRRLLIAAGPLAALLLAGPSPAQPLEQNFAFGAPPGVLGNDRVRVRPPAFGRPEPTARRGQVRVRLGQRSGVTEERRHR